MDGTVAVARMNSTSAADSMTTDCPLPKSIALITTVIVVCVILPPLMDGRDGEMVANHHISRRNVQRLLQVGVALRGGEVKMLIMTGYGMAGAANQHKRHVFHLIQIRIHLNHPIMCFQSHHGRPGEMENGQ